MKQSNSTFPKCLKNFSGDSASIPTIPITIETTARIKETKDNLILMIDLKGDWEIKNG